MTRPTPPDPHEGINPAANREAEAVERDQTSYVARGGQSSGIVDNGPAPGDEQPSKAVAGGTAGGDPLAGVTAGGQDVELAVSGDTGSERPGTQG
ncbi:MAG: hypothetical protein M3P46_08025 [Actinomycetota bacterium]|nr:hypothetical protein [Actinomycetota bacterium]